MAVEAVAARGRTSMAEPARAPRTPSRTRARSPPTPATPEPESPGVSANQVAELNRYVLEEDGPSLRNLSAQASAGQVDFGALEATAYFRSTRPSTTGSSSHSSTSHREKAMEFFAHHFNVQSMRDEWFVALAGLLDRTAVAMSRARNAEKSGQATDEWLAAVLIVLKQFPCEAEFDLSPRDLVYKISALPKQVFLKAWPRIVAAEFKIYRALDYRVALPTALELCTHMALTMCGRLQNASAGDAAAAVARWPGLAEGTLPAPRADLGSPMPRVALLAAMLVELAVLHAPENVYAKDSSPLALALACLRLAVHAFGEPPAQCLQALEAVRDEALPNNGRQGVEEQQLEKAAFTLVKKVHQLWVRRLPDSKPMKKWRSRTDLHLPTALKELPSALREQVLRTPSRQRAPSPSMSLSRTKKRAPGGLSDLANSLSPAPRRAEKSAKVAVTPDTCDKLEMPGKGGAAGRPQLPQLSLPGRLSLEPAPEPSPAASQPSDFGSSQPLPPASQSQPSEPSALQSQPSEPPASQSQLSEPAASQPQSEPAAWEPAPMPEPPSPAVAVAVEEERPPLAAPRVPFRAASAAQRLEDTRPAAAPVAMPAAAPAAPRPVVPAAEPAAVPVSGSQRALTPFGMRPEAVAALQPAARRSASDGLAPLIHERRPAPVVRQQSTSSLLPEPEDEEALAPEEAPAPSAPKRPTVAEDPVARRLPFENFTDERSFGAMLAFASRAAPAPASSACSSTASAAAVQEVATVAARLRQGEALMAAIPVSVAARLDQQDMAALFQPAQATAPEPRASAAAPQGQDEGSRVEAQGRKIRLTLVQRKPSDEGVQEKAGTERGEVQGAKYRPNLEEEEDEDAEEDSRNMRGRRRRRKVLDDEESEEDCEDRSSTRQGAATRSSSRLRAQVSAEDRLAVEAQAMAEIRASFLKRRKMATMDAAEEAFNCEPRRSQRLMERAQAQLR